MAYQKAVRIRLKYDTQCSVVRINICVLYEMVFIILTDCRCCSCYKIDIPLKFIVVVYFMFAINVLQKLIQNLVISFKSLECC